MNINATEDMAGIKMNIVGIILKFRMKFVKHKHFLSFLTGNEFCERLAYYGIAKNLITYLKVKLHLGNLEAARTVTTWQGTCYLTPLIGAILADSHWGKYWTIAVFSSVYFIVSTKILSIKL
jgi:dipeptide/tripeptide permease